MRISNKQLIQELKKVDYLLKENLNHNLTFKKLYEKENNDKIEDEDLKIKFLLGAPYPRRKRRGITGAPARPFGAAAKIGRLLVMI
jgi:hypothetical protein